MSLLFEPNKFLLLLLVNLALNLPPQGAEAEQTVAVTPSPHPRSSRPHIGTYGTVIVTNHNVT